MKTIGLTGGIGSGKSSASNYLSEKGITVIEADEISRHLVLPGSDTLNSLIQIFGKKILNDDGTLNRKLLARIVFNDKERLKILNQIMHERIISEIDKQLKEYKENIIVIDAPLLIETGLDKMVDVIWVVDVDKETQIERIKKRDNLSYEEIKSRIESQLSREERNRHADIILDNSGNLIDLYGQIDEALKYQQDLWSNMRD